MSYPCIICEEELEDVFCDSGPGFNQPVGGTEFSSRGHYGSTVVDGDGLVTLNICDACLCDKIRRGIADYKDDNEIRIWLKNSHTS